MIDLRFATAMQLMLSLALAAEHGIPQLTSAELAAGLGVASSFVRKLITPLARDGLVVSAMGKHGGVGLSRPANRITLGDIYTAVMEDKRLWRAREDVPHRCLVSSNIVPFFDTIAQDAGSAVLKVLEKRTLASSLAQLRHIDNGDRVAA
jgi:Rrf2 family transcriptional repressor of oqxAB